MTAPFSLADGLTNLANDFDQFIHGGIVLDGEAVVRLTKYLLQLGHRARELENEVRPTRRRAPAHETSMILAEVQRPGTNVKLFPMIPRPLSDRNPRGTV